MDGRRCMHVCICIWHFRKRRAVFFVCWTMVRPELCRSAMHHVRTYNRSVISELGGHCTMVFRTNEKLKKKKHNSSRFKTKGTYRRCSSFASSILSSKKNPRRCARLPRVCNKIYIFVYGWFGKRIAYIAHKLYTLFVLCCVCASNSSIAHLCAHATRTRTILKREKTTQSPW